jgi:hypothetical protein
MGHWSAQHVGAVDTPEYAHSQPSVFGGLILLQSRWLALHAYEQTAPVPSAWPEQLAEFAFVGVQTWLQAPQFAATFRGPQPESNGGASAPVSATSGPESVTPLLLPLDPLLLPLTPLLLPLEPLLLPVSPPLPLELPLTPEDEPDSPPPSPPVVTTLPPSSQIGAHFCSVMSLSPVMLAQPPKVIRVHATTAVRETRPTCEQ